MNIDPAHLFSTLFGGAFIVTGLLARYLCWRDSRRQSARAEPPNPAHGINVAPFRRPNRLRTVRRVFGPGHRVLVPTPADEVLAPPNRRD